MHEGFTNEELLNMQRRDEADRRTAIDREVQESIDREVQESIDRANRPSIDNNPPSSISVRNHHPLDSDGYTRAIDGHALHVSREDIADILQIAKGPDNLFMQQHNIPAYQQRVTKEFYDTAGGVDNRYKQKNRHHTRPSIDVDDPTSVDRCPEFGKRAYDRDGIRRFHWEKKDEYGVYRDDQGHATDVDGHTIQHASSFTQTMLVPEIYTKDEINEMFYGVCGAQEKNEGDFQIKLDCVYHPLNDSISWLTTCMEEMRQDLAKIQRAAEVSRQASIDRNRPPSIDNRLPASVDDNLPHLHPMKFPPDFHTRVENDQLIEDIYRTLQSTEERLDRRLEIQSYIAHRPEVSTSIDRRNNKLTDIQRQTSVDDATNRGRLVPKVTSEMSDTHNHGEEISDDTYATLMRHPFNLESLGDRLQKIENTTAIIKDKWRRGDEAMRDFTVWRKKEGSNLNYVIMAVDEQNELPEAVGEKYSGIEFLQTPGRTPASGSLLGGTPAPCYEVHRVRSQGPPPSPGKRKTSDKENLPYFRKWKSLNYSNRLRPALERLYKGNLNPKAGDRYFKT
ncbi:hypothetical protein DY000_02039607 [Brassica cretica]|uniref:Uncharacterized protein n=1 Tax=Brassica cretica TaxID=69181 RepID=A0ABQ7BCT4_BRACR|nr:hypothetical protein DY000_02039607 [Brassica cretica]